MLKATRTPFRQKAFKRLFFAAIDLWAINQVVMLVLYYAIRALGGGQLWFIDVLTYLEPWMYAPLIVLIPAALLRRSRLLVSLVPVSALLFALIHGGVYLPRPSASAAGPALTAMTYNVFYRNPRVDRAADVIRAHAPDIVGLQESVPWVVEPLEDELAAEYPYRRTERWCGFFSRYPILEYETMRLGTGADLGLCSQRFLIDVDGRAVTVFNVHVRPPALSPLLTLASLLDVPSHLVNLGRDVDVRDLVSRVNQVDGPVIVLGDFNTTEQHRSYALLTRSLHDAYREGARGLGFTVNSFRSAGPSLWRVDYVFHSPHLATLDATVGGNGGSDHRPVIARLAFL